MNMFPVSPVLRQTQRGISLVVTLLIVILMSLLAIYGAGVLVLDTRSASNDYMYRQAMAAAESGVEQGFALLNANRTRIGSGGIDLNGDGDTTDTGEAWVTCTATATPCLAIRSGDRTNWMYSTVTGLAAQPTSGGSFTLFMLTPTTGDSSLFLYNIVAVGLSADSQSGTPTTATVKQGAYFYPLIVGAVDVPLAAASNIPLGGNYCIVTNPNGGGTGVPVSVWAPDAFTTSGSGSFATVNVGEFDGSCPNPATDEDLLSTGDTIGADLVNDDDFPADLFQYLFGVSEDDYLQIKNQATVLANCSTLTSASAGLFWITGDCDPSADIGSSASPVILVVEGDVSFTANDDMYGILYLFDPAGGTRELQSAGTAHMHGSIIAHDSNVTLDLLGDFIIQYDSAALENLKNSLSGRGLARIPGSWSDVQ